MIPANNESNMSTACFTMVADYVAFFKTLTNTESADILLTKVALSNYTLKHTPAKMRIFIIFIKFCKLMQVSCSKTRKFTINIESLCERGSRSTFKEKFSRICTLFADIFIDLSVKFSIFPSSTPPLNTLTNRPTKLSHSWKKRGGVCGSCMVRFLLMFVSRMMADGVFLGVVAVGRVRPGCPSRHFHDSV